MLSKQDPFDLTEDERVALNVVLGEINGRAKHSRPMTVETLVSAWGKFVERLEQGYGMSIYDYANDLAVRDLLDEVVAGVPGRLAESITARVEHLDDRYRLATRPTDRPLLPGRDAFDSPRWWRVPRRVSGELKDDLAAEGLLTD